MRPSSGARKPFAFDRRYLDRAVMLGAFALEQVRDCCLRKGRHSWSDRAEDALTLLYVMSGETVLAVGDSERPFAARQYMLIAPGAGWQLVSAPTTSARIIAVSFRLVQIQAGGPYRELLAEPADGGAEPLTDDGRLEEWLLGLMKELELPDSHTRTMAESYLLQIGVRLCRDRGEQAASPSGGEAVQTAAAAGRAELVYETIRYLDQHLEEIRELGELAAAIGYSYSHLSHVFRLEMGESLQSYWAGRRTLRAMKLLQAGRTSITRIAEMLHYQSIHSFSKAFKKTTGLTPSEYQELYGPPSDQRKEDMPTRREHL